MDGGHYHHAQEVASQPPAHDLSPQLMAASSTSNDTTANPQAPKYGTRAHDAKPPPKKRLARRRSSNQENESDLKPLKKKSTKDASSFKELEEDGEECKLAIAKRPSTGLETNAKIKDEHIASSNDSNQNDVIGCTRLTMIPETAVESFEPVPVPIPARRGNTVSRGSSFIDTVVVPTKTEDGGSSMLNEAAINRNGRDAFLLYSNDSVRRMAILGLPVDNPEAPVEEVGMNAAAANQGNGQDIANILNREDRSQPIRRRTRLSFEIYDIDFYIRQM